MDLHHSCVARPRAILIAKVLKALHPMNSLIRQCTRLQNLKQASKDAADMQSVARRPSPE